MLDLSLGNLVAWAIQVAALGIAGVLLPAAVRVTSPGARLLFLRAVLVVCLVLPLVQPWVPQAARTPAAAALPSVADADAAALALQGDSAATGSRALSPQRSDALPARWPIEIVVGAVYAAGLALRLGWLGLGLLSLSRLRRQSAVIDPRPASLGDAGLLTGVEAEFRMSSRVVRPVTFGLRRPVVLVPPDFLTFESAQQTAVAAHELLHVARRDWVRTLGDELVLSIVWFHPALWWLIEQIHLNVEQVVDREVVARVGARKPYLEALLKLAAAGPTPMLQPASLFLKHGHLAQRVALLVREASMSRVRLVASFVVVLAVLAASGLYVVQAFPLRAVFDPAVLPSVPAAVAFIQAPAPPPPPPPPPPPAPPAKVVAVQLPQSQQTKPTVDPKVQAPAPGALPVIDGSLESYVALAKRYEAAGDLKNAEKTYLDLTRARPKDPAAFLNLAGYYNRRQDFDKTIAALVQRAAVDPNNPEGPYTLATYFWDKAYRDSSLSDAQKLDLVEKGLGYADAALYLKPDYIEGLTYKNLLLRLKATMETDPARQQALIAEADKLRDQAIKIKANRDAWAAIPPNAVRVGGNIKPPTKVKDVKPVYPAVASTARVQGVVIVEAVISPVGTVQATRVLRSIPLLDQAAIDAVNQWQFEPTLLNAVAIPVVMTVTVNFTLADGKVGGVPGGVAGGLDTGVEIPPPPPPPPVPLPPDTVRIGGEIRPPTKIVDVKPVYPEDAKQAGIQGVVIFELLVGKDGKVQSAKLLRSIPALDQAAADAVKQWVFTPTLVSGTPMNVVMTVTVNFTLQ